MRLFIVDKCAQPMSARLRILCGADVTLFPVISCPQKRQFSPVFDRFLSIFLGNWTKINKRIDPNKVRIGRGFLVETIAVCIRQLGILEYALASASISS